MDYNLSAAKVVNFAGKIRGWYDKKKRVLPWRGIRDPYTIWISEIILQQTRIDQGSGYYRRFMEAFPRVEDLASASLDEVLKIWQGLGYYSRARNLHEAARYIMDELGGKIPGTYAGLLGLKGVGEYTAAAIASICFGEPVAAVDGNVTRVIARIFGVEHPVGSAGGKARIRELAGELLDRSNPGDHNQAMMEFGALQCVPGVPVCSACPLSKSCNAYLTGRVVQLPVMRPRRRPVERWIYFYVLRKGTQLLLEKRDSKGIWKSLYQFPAVESDASKAEDTLLKEELEKLLPGCGPFTIRKVSGTIRHQLSHRTLQARFIHVRPDSFPHPLPERWLVVPADRLNDFPVPRLINRYMEVTRI